MREVRQRCGFGCVLCGKPIYQYDHIFGWPTTLEHVVEEITLLCAEHHDEKTRGFLPNEKVIEANGAPFNLKTGVTKPYDLRFEGSEYEIRLGSVTMSGQDNGVGTEVQAIRIDGQAMIGVVLLDGHFLFFLNVVDPYNRLVLQIFGNELTVNLLAWDVEIVGTHLIVREGLGKILFDIRFVLPHTVVIERGRFLRNGVELLIVPSWGAVLNNPIFFSNVGMINCFQGVALGIEPGPTQAAFRFENIPRYGWDRAKAVRWARDSVKQMEAASAAMAELLDDPGQGNGSEEPAAESPPSSE
jgi:hypothetical protein